ncbi:MAG: anti-sigma factor antagonist [Frankiaceae bacterium]|jgi:anti-anti-sigma factor|nr:anti-sigma factor antagonist [Frankiaceae bacterium]
MHDADGFFADGNVLGATSGPIRHGLAVHGELDIATLPLLELAFTEPECDPERDFVLDLRAMTFVDLTGIRALAHIVERVTSGAHLAVVAPSESRGVQRMVGLAVLNGWLPGAFTFSPAVVGPQRTPFDGAEDEDLTERA